MHEGVTACIQALGVGREGPGGEGVTLNPSYTPRTGERGGCGGAALSKQSHQILVSKQL